MYLNSNDVVCLAMSKNRVTPIKSTTLPRSELMAAVTATRLTEFVCSSIPHDRQRLRVHFWIDSQIVLHWIHQGTNPKPFISHRVKEICEAFPAAIWSFTPSADNPADLLTRGLSTDQLKSSRLWTHGPDWLLNRSAWPTWSPTSILHLQAEEEASPGNPHTENISESAPCILSIVGRWGLFYRTEQNGTELWTKLWNGTLSQNEACSLPLLKLPLQVIDGPPAGD